MRKKANLKARFLTNLVMALTVLFFSQCKKDDLQSELENSVSGLGKMDPDVKLAATGIISSSYYLENALPSGYVKDGSKDYTSYVQAAVNKYNNIVFPDFPIQVNNRGILIGSNKTITFLEGSEVRLKGSADDNYNVLHIYNASNVTLYNPVVIGDRESHIGTSGEFGIGIGIRGSSDVKIYNPKVTHCWGDGIYIGQAAGKGGCKNIYIKDAYLYKNRRDGIGIISVDGLLIDNIYAGYTDGTKPWAGINFEPNNSSCELKNIRINNPRTENNGANGIQIIPFHMIGSTNKTADITIVNHVDISSPRYAVKMFCNPPETVTGKLYATINLVNPSWQKTGTSTPLVLSTNQPNIKTNVYSPEIINTFGSIFSYSKTYELLMAQTRTGTISVSNLIPSIFDALIPDLSSPTSPIAEPVTDMGDATAIFAVNCGGGSFKSSTNGITYQADKYFSGGSIYKTTNSISGTSDDELFQTERYGDFAYNIPLSDGSYEITFKFSEIFHKALDRRSFDVLAENSTIISDLDIYEEVGSNDALNITKTVNVADGTLNLRFSTNLDNAKIGAFHIIKK